jgi:hypothetical protein
VRGIVCVKGTGTFFPLRSPDSNEIPPIGTVMLMRRGICEYLPRTDKHLPPSTFTGQFLRKADIKGFVFL